MKKINIVTVAITILSANSIFAEDILHYEPSNPEWIKLKKEDECGKLKSTINEKTKIYATGGYSGRELDFQIDESGHSATTYEVLVNSPNEPVALILGSYEPAVWDIAWVEGTEIQSVLLTGYYAQKIAGLKGETPVLEAFFRSESGCPYAYVNSNELEKLMDISKMAFKKDIDEVVMSSGYSIVGNELKGNEKFYKSSKITVDSFKDETKPLSGKKGVEQLVQRGILRKATFEDIELMYLTSKESINDYRDLIEERNETYLEGNPIYVVTEEMTFPAGLYGAHSVEFLIPYGVPYPKGNPGHSIVMDMNNLEEFSAKGQPISVIGSNRYFNFRDMDEVLYFLKKEEYIKKATLKDKESWAKLLYEKEGENIPKIKGVKEPWRIKMPTGSYHSYVVLKPFSLPRNIDGRSMVTFYVSEDFASDMDMNNDEACYFDFSTGEVKGTAHYCTQK